MDFEPSSEQQMLIDMVRRFVRTEIIPLEAKLDPDASELPADEFARLNRMVRGMGFWGLDIPAEYGGAGIDLVYPVYYICFAMSANTQRRERTNVVMRGMQGDLRGSLPVVALMVGVIALLQDRLNLTAGDSPLLVLVVLLATALVVVSQALATREVVGLHREVATRRFDERLTELVRRSSDMIAICDIDGVIRYASPSSEQLLGATPGELNGQRLDDVLGPEALHVREAFNQVLATPNSEQNAVFSIPQTEGEKRSFKMVIANLCHVDSIRGITLNIRDVSDAARLNDQLRTLAFHDPLTLLRHLQVLGTDTICAGSLQCNRMLLSKPEKWRRSSVPKPI